MNKHPKYTLLFSDFPICFADINLVEGAVVYRYSKNNPMNATEPRFFSEYSNANSYDKSFGNSESEIWECTFKQVKLIDFRMLKYVIYNTLENMDENILNKIEKSNNSHIQKFIYYFLYISGLMPVKEQNKDMKNLSYPLHNYGYRYSIHSSDDYVFAELKKHFELNYDGYISPQIPSINGGNRLTGLMCEICLFNPSKSIKSAEFKTKNKNIKFIKNLSVFNKSPHSCIYSHQYLNPNKIYEAIKKNTDQKFINCKLLSFHTFDIKWGVVNLPENLIIFRATNTDPIDSVNPRWFGNHETGLYYKNKYGGNLFACMTEKIKLVDIRVLKYIILEISLYLYKHDLLNNKMKHKLDCFMTAFGLHSHKLQLINIKKNYKQNNRESPYSLDYKNKNIYIKNSGSRMSYGPTDNIAVSYINDLIGHKIDGYICPNLKSPWLEKDFKHEICLLNPNKCLKKTLGMNSVPPNVFENISKLDKVLFDTIDADCKLNITRLEVKK